MREFVLKKGPYMRSKQTTTKIMNAVFIALIPIILFTFFKNGIYPYYQGKVTLYGMVYPLVFIFVSVLTTVITEYFMRRVVRKEKVSIKELSYAILPGLFLSLVLPMWTPLFLLVLGGMVSILIGKQLFGGFGKNWFNPALVGALFVMICLNMFYPNYGGYLNSYEKDAISKSTPLTNIKVVGQLGDYDSLVEPYGSLLDFFIGTTPGAVGETSALLCILAFAYLVYKKSVKWKITLTYVLTVFGLCAFIGAFSNLGIWYPLFQVMSGGLLFGAIFMATDPVTSPMTPIGQILYGLSLGILTVFIRYLTPYPEGVMVSILIMNLFTKPLDEIGAISRFHFEKCLPIFVILWVAIGGLGFYVGTKYQVEPPKLDEEGNQVEVVDKNFKVISKQTVGPTTTYVVTQLGYHGPIKAQVVFVNGVVSTYQILEQNENQAIFQNIINANYLNNLVVIQNNLESADTISGATVSSNALIHLLENTIKDYQKSITQE
ncbi:MAG: RnfABCDGE type electron transport complex subunit D [Firmicutes bacterium]|nr:RnfABCDGE type electron transport complex subunit D [Bacillota bacterium]